MFHSIYTFLIFDVIYFNRFSLVTVFFLVLYLFHIFLIRDKYTIFCRHLSMLLFLPFIRILVKSHYISFGVYFFVFFSPLLKQRSDSIIQALFIIFFMHIFFVKEESR